MSEHAKGAERALYAAFACQACASGIVLPRVPDLQAKLQLTETELGTVFTVGALGGILTSFIAGDLARRWGTKWPAVLSILVMALGNLVTALVTSVYALGAVFFVNGLAFGLSNVAMNLEADRQETASQRRIMNRCHGFWSVGVLVATLVGVGARAGPVPLFWHFAAMLCVLALVLCWLAATLTQAPARSSTKTKRSAFAHPDSKSALIVLFAFSASVAHMSANTWSVIFARDSFNAADWVDTLTLPAFLGAMTAARLLADLWIERWGPVTVARLLAVVAAIGLLTIVTSPNATLAILGFGLIGLGAGPLFPMMVSAAGRVTHRAPEDSVASVILLITAVATVSPVVMGAVAEAIGLRLMFLMLIPFCAMTFVLARPVNQT